MPFLKPRLSSALFASIITLALLPKVQGEVSFHTPKEERALQYIVPNKKKVSKGEILAVFDCASIATELHIAQKELKALKAATEAAQRDAAAAEKLADEKIALATYEISRAEKTLSKYIEGDAPTTEITLNLALADAEANFKQQSERYAVRDKMLEEGYIRKVEYDNEELLLQKTRLQRDAAKLKLNAFLKYDKEQTAEQHARTLKASKAALEKTKLEQEAAIAKAQKAIETCGKAESAKTKECEFLQKQLDATVITAPLDGTFSYPEKAQFARGTTLPTNRLLGTLAP